MKKSYITFNVCTTSDYKPVGIEVKLDEQTFYNAEEFVGSKVIQLDMPEDTQDHVLSIILKNKTPGHTVIDSSGHIVQDTNLLVSDIEFDQVPIGYNILNLAEYHYDNSVHKFHGEMGCNGQMTLKFTAPVYRWLLENM